MATKASIGYRMHNGRIYYVNCRYDGGLKHVGRLLLKRHNDIDKALDLILGGDIVSLRKDLESTIRERPLGNDQLEDCEVKEAYWIGDFLLNSNGEYKYLYDKGRWYVVGGLYEADCVTPLRGPLPLAKAIEIWLM